MGVRSYRTVSEFLNEFVMRDDNSAARSVECELLEADNLGQGRTAKPQSNGTPRKNASARLV